MSARSNQTFEFSLMTADVVENIARSVAKSDAVVAVLREVITEQLAAHQEAADTITLLEQMHQHQSEARASSADQGPQPPA